MSHKTFRKNEGGSTMAEFAIIAGVFFMIIFGIIEFGRLLYTHNALTDAARRAARYAIIHPPEVATDGLPYNNATCVNNVAIYGETHVSSYATGCTPNGPPLINGIQNATINVRFDGADLDGNPATPNPYGSNLGTVTVTIEGYQFNLSIPFAQRTLTLPDYTTTLTAESAGYEPPII